VKTPDSLTAAQARHYAKRILAECSDSFKNVKARRVMFGKGTWEVAINGGMEGCYGRTADNVESAEWILETFKNDLPAK